MRIRMNYYTDPDPGSGISPYGFKSASGSGNSPYGSKEKVIISIFPTKFK